ncbi:MAG TPA: Rnase Y domain-containing protein, partial [Chloroflexota bacterium]|nr:Rnase Y domain-containing protein [Chloroflexota bacterium]
MTIALFILVAVVVGVAGFGGGLALKRARSDSLEREANAKIETLLAEARAQEKDILLQAKDEALKVRAAAENEAREARSESQRTERRLSQKEENLDRKLEALDKRERNITAKEQETEELHEAMELKRLEQVKELERVASMTREEAKTQLLSNIEQEVRVEANKRVREIEFEAKEEGEQKARKIIALAIQKYASDQVSESAVSVVPLPSEDMKGRIIGREGRNIRALEAATGVDLIIDDTPDTVILSGFDPVRREVARQALTKLIVDGRIHPGRIEELVAKARLDVENTMRDEGEKAAA